MRLGCWEKKVMGCRGRFLVCSVSFKICVLYDWDLVGSFWVIYLNGL